MRYLRCFVVVMATVAVGCTRDVTPITAPENGPPIVRVNSSVAATTATPQVSAGYVVTCALRQEGSIACFGDNTFGTGAPPAGAYTQIDLTYYTACAVAAGGSLACWGFNGTGQVSPPSGTNYKQVSAGLWSSCAVRTDETVACWGYPSVMPVPAGTYTQVAVGGDHACAVRTDGTLACWGDDESGQVSGMPTAPAGRQFTQLSAGLVHTCALLDDGSIQCWGSNTWGQLNVAALPAGTKYTQVTVSNFPADFDGFHTCALRSDGMVACWGQNKAGQLNVPALPLGMTYTNVSAGAFHSCAARSDGAVVCWGVATSGQATPPTTLNLLKQTQPIVFTPAVPNPAPYGQTVQLVPNAGSGAPVVLASSTPSVCTISGTTVSFVALGTCSFTADRAGDATFEPAPQLGVSVTVARQPQTITFVSTPPNPAYIGDIYTVTATGGGSGNTVFFSTLTSNTCMPSGNKLTLIGAGTCTFVGIQAGNAYYDESPQTPQSFTVSKRPQAITFTPALPAESPIGSQVTVVPTGGGSGNPVTISVQTPATCTLSAGKLSLTSVGDCMLAADQAGNATYDAAPQKTVTIGVRWPFSFVGLNNPPTVNNGKIGGSIAVTFSLGGNRGLPVMLATSPTVAAYACGTTPPQPGSGTSVRTVANNAGATYNEKTGTYTYTWKVDKALKGCVQLSLSMRDGSIRTLLFQLR